MNQRKNKFYIASPFFNPVQVAVVEAIEKVFLTAGVDFFSPRLLDENKGPGALTPQEAQVIFRKDIQGMLNCDAVLANLDWRLPGKQEVRVLDPDKHLPPDGGGPNFVSPPLNIPDSGAVFEMGFAWCRTFLSQHWRSSEAFDAVAACNKAAEALPGGRLQSDLMEVRDMLEQLRRWLTPMRMVIFTERPAKAGLNLMLTQGASGVVNGIESLTAFLGRNGEPNWDLLKPWTGGNR